MKVIVSTKNRITAAKEGRFLRFNKKKSFGLYSKIILRYLFIIIIAAFLFTPFILAFLGTVKTNAEIIAWPPKILPEHWLWNNWLDTWNTNLGRGGTFPRWLFNTAFLAVVTATLQVLFCSMGGYAFARLKFRGKNIIFNFMLSSMMLPGIVTLVPKYVMMAKIHLINTYWALILPGSVEAFGIFLLTQYFKYCDYELTKNMTLQYLNQIMHIYSQATYRKRVLQIRKWLRFLNLNYLDNMKMPSEPSYFPIYISIEDINHALQYFNNHSYEKQGKALIMLGAYTGLRSSEIYRLKLKKLQKLIKEGIS